jgi:hypothetical protein
MVLIGSDVAGRSGISDGTVGVNAGIGEKVGSRELLTGNIGTVEGVSTVDE